MRAERAATGIGIGTGTMDKKIEYHMTAFRKLCSTTAITTSTALLLAVPTIVQS